MTTDDGIIPVEVFAGTALQASIVKSLLENAEINAYLKDEFTGVLYPWHTTPGGVGAVKVIVSSADVEKARMVVAEFEDNLKKERNE
jgi:hypothetical protein